LHGAARGHYERLSAEGTQLVTTSFVIDEVATRLRYDLGIRDALEFRDALVAADRSARLRIAWVDRSLMARAWEVLERYADVPFSFTDATTVAVARSRRIRTVFTFDDDFGAAGLAVEPG
jgi:predicted nucleic acid-binding protein